jgi:hypothetical protein
VTHELFKRTRFPCPAPARKDAKWLMPDCGQPAREIRGRQEGLSCCASPAKSAEPQSDAGLAESRLRGNMEQILAAAAPAT